MLLTADKSILLIVDIQEKLYPAMHGGREMLAESVKLAKGARIAEVPTLISEQNPAGIGATVSAIIEAAHRPKIMDKTTFSCAADPAIADAAAKLKRTGRHQMVICGTEAHVCVLQSALGFRATGFDVAVVVDAITSRTPLSKDTAIARLATSGVTLATTEMVLFEWVGNAEHKSFKPMLGLIK